MVFIVIVLLAVGGFLFYASYAISCNVYLKAFCKTKTSKKILALTFDDGPDPIQTPKILDVLNKYHVKATFFCIGSKIDLYPQIVERIHQEGHLIGNHSYSHSNIFPFYSSARMMSDLSTCQTCIENITHTKSRFFRPPFGVTNPRIAKLVKMLHYTTVGWSVRSLDTVSKSPQKVLARIQKQLHSGAIILLHDHLPQSDLLLDMLLIHLQKEGYELRRVDEMSE